MGAPGRSEPADLLSEPAGPYPPTARRILEAVELIPPGRVLTYGDVAEFVGLRSGRVVGNVLHRFGHEVPWWRVVRSTGHPAPSHPAEAISRLAVEGVPLTRDGSRVDLAHARWDGR